jgi:hypothetical protein
MPLFDDGQERNAARPMRSRQRRFLISLTLLLWPVAFCQQQDTDRPLGAEATLSDLTISCQVDPDTAMARVTLVSLAPKRIYMQYQNNVDARSNYEATATDQNGEHLPKAETPVPSGPGIRVVREASSGPVTLDPRQQRVEKFPLSALVELPREGKLRVRLGRGLFSERNDPFRLDVSKMLWCAPIDVFLRPAKPK